jgi:hypothetical protein
MESNYRLSESHRYDDLKSDEEHDNFTLSVGLRPRSISYTYGIDKFENILDSPILPSQSYMFGYIEEYKLDNHSSNNASNEIYENDFESDLEEEKQESPINIQEGILASTTDLVLASRQLSFNYIIDTAEYAEIEEEIEVEISFDEDLPIMRLELENNLPAARNPQQNKSLISFEEDRREQDHKSETDSINSSKTPLFASSIRDDRWICPICLDIYEEPVETPCCHNLFCEKCVKNLRKCPLCNRYIDRCIPNIPIRRLMDDLILKCKYDQCIEVIRKAEFKKHIENCPMAPIDCIHSTVCGTIIRKNYSKHIVEECPYRPIACPLECGRTLEYLKLEDHLSLECPCVIVNCPQNCKTIINRGELDNHILHDCPNSIIACTNRDGRGVRCSTKCIRKEMPEHKLICYFRKISCKNTGCNEQVIYNDLESHESQCPFKIIECDKECGRKIPRNEYRKHLAEVCPLNLINCPYYELGCQSKILRKDNDQHLREEAVQHSILTATGMKDLRRQLKRLEDMIVSMKEGPRIDDCFDFGFIRR